MENVTSETSPSVQVFDLPALTVHVRRDAPHEVTHDAGFAGHFVCVQQRAGRGTITVEAGSARFASAVATDDVLVVPTGTPFTCGWTEETTTVGLVVPEREVAKAWRAMSGRPAAAVTVRLELSVRDQRLSWLARELARDLAVAEAPNTLFTDAVSHAIVAHLAGAYAEGSTRSVGRSSPLSSESVARVIQFMQDNLGAGFSLGALADVAGMSKYHFARTFREATGSSPWRYLIDLRLERGRELLGRTDASVSDVAALVGFADASHFRRAFRAKFGRSPRR